MAYSDKNCMVSREEAERIRLREEKNAKIAKMVEKWFGQMIEKEKEKEKT